MPTMLKLALSNLARSKSSMSSSPPTADATPQTSMTSGGSLLGPAHMTSSLSGSSSATSSRSSSSSSSFERCVSFVAQADDNRGLLTIPPNFKGLTPGNSSVSNSSLLSREPSVARFPSSAVLDSNSSPPAALLSVGSSLDAPPGPPLLKRLALTDMLFDAKNGRFESRCMCNGWYALSWSAVRKGVSSGHCRRCGAACEVVFDKATAPKDLSGLSTAAACACCVARSPNAKYACPVFHASLSSLVKDYLDQVTITERQIVEERRRQAAEVFLQNNLNRATTSTNLAITKSPQLPVRAQSFSAFGAKHGSQWSPSRCGVAASVSSCGPALLASVPVQASDSTASNPWSFTDEELQMHRASSRVAAPRKQVRFVH